MIGFIVTLLVLLVGAGAGSRGAYSFSVDVPSPVLASITGGGPATPPPTNTAGQPGGGNPGTSGGNAGNAPSPPYPTISPAEPGSAPGTVAPEPTVKKGSNWPTIILGTVLVLGGILIALYFITRNRDD